MAPLASSRFNPRPPLLAGEPLVRSCDTAKVENEPVSIHARHCWRANRTVLPVTAVVARVSIHARHCWRANQLAVVGGPTLLPFQSTPAIAGGRTVRALMHLGWRANLGDFVSIHARHCWRANPLVAGRQRQARHFTGVSIHARHCWRANPFCIQSFVWKQFFLVFARTLQQVH
jgi:hypothetical protein